MSRPSVRPRPTSSRPRGSADSTPASEAGKEAQRETEGESEAFEREEGQGGRGGRRGGPRAAREAEARTSPEAASRDAIREERGAAQVPPPRVVPLPEVRGRVAKAARRAIETPPPFRVPLEPPVDRVSWAARRSRASSERLPRSPRAQRTPARRSRRVEAGGADRARGRHPKARDD